VEKYGQMISQPYLRVITKLFHLYEIVTFLPTSIQLKDVTKVCDSPV